MHGRWTLALLASCCPAASTPVSEASPQPVTVTLVESTPSETDLGFDDVPDTATVWADMIARAKHSLELSQFYISNNRGGMLEPVLAAIEKAAANGVVVRVLVDASFAQRYPVPLERLEQVAAVRRWAVADSLGGVQHAKYFVVDGWDAYVGSANFDWRALEHIHELGVRIEGVAISGALAELFARDWAAAAKEPAAARTRPWSSAPQHDGGSIRLVASPMGALPDDDGWTLDAIVQQIDNAEHSICIQLLSYDAAYRDGRPFATLDDAIRSAANRGVAVRLLLADWQKRSPQALQELQQLAHVEVRLVTIPTHSSGFIPYARVIHAKYMVVDERSAWIGSSNWKGDYFYQSRNAGVVVRGGTLPTRLQRSFEQVWQSDYALSIDPHAHYEPPRIGP